MHAGCDYYFTGPLASTFYHIGRTTLASERKKIGSRRFSLIAYRRTTDVMRTVLFLTIGPTHAGKTTFARQLAQRLPASLVIDQDLQARFLLEHYPDLVPTEGPNQIKHDLTGWLIEQAITSSFETIILCNANTTRTVGNNY